MADILDKFRIVDNKTTQRNVREVEDVPVDALEQQFEMAESIGQTTAYELGLKPILLERIEELDGLMELHIDSHAKLADAHGRLMEVKGFLALFEKSEGE